MNEHSFSLESLIGGWYIPEKVCDNLIDYFEDNKNNHIKTNTIVGKKDVVDDTRMTLDKYNKPKPFENYLTQLDLVSNFYVTSLNSKNTIYKIIFNGNPDQFLNLMNDKDIDIDTNQEIWKIR